MAYFVRIRGRAFGPYEASQLLEMKSQGRVTRVTEISEDRHNWQAAETYDWLFPKPAPPSPDPPRPGPPQSDGNEPADWFYSINGTEGYGPVTASTIKQMLQSGQLNNNSYVWQQGQNARFIKDEPKFLGGVGGGVSIDRSHEKTTTGGGTGGDPPNIGGTITGATETVDTGQMLRPIAASLGWLMFLKITFLIVGVIFQGLYLLWSSVMMISASVGADSAMVLLVALITLVIWAGLYGLQFKTFLCFWKYHTNLNQTVATGRASDLIQGNQSQFLLWKWLGITVIAHLAVFLISVTVILAIAGLGSGLATNPFQF